MGLETVERGLFYAIWTVHRFRRLTTFPCNVPDARLPGNCRSHRDHSERHREATDPGQFAAIHENIDVCYAEGMLRLQSRFCYVNFTISIRNVLSLNNFSVM